MKTRLLLPLFVLILLGLAACQKGDVVETTAVPDNTTEEAATPEPTRPSQNGVTILADGSVVAVQPVLPLSFSTSGRLLTLAVQPGDVVAAGDLIATLDDKTLQDAVTNAELQVAQSEINLAQATAELNKLQDWTADETAVALAEANLTYTN